MNHWPSFEPFESAGESGRFLALWPSVVPDEDPETIEAAVPVEPETAAAAPQSPVPPAVDPADQAARPTGARGIRFSPLLLLGSLAVHAAAIALTAHFLTQPGVEAETDAVSVEIVVDATPNPNTDPSLAGEAAADAENKPKAAKRTTDEVRAASSETPAERHVVPPQPPFSLPATPPVIDSPKALATPETAEVQVPRPNLILPKAPPKVEVARPAPMTPEMVTRAVPAPALRLADAPPPIADDAEPPLALPDEAPLPTPAPDGSNPATKADTAMPTKEASKTVQGRRETRTTAQLEPNKHPATRAPRQDHRASDRNPSAGVGNEAGRGSVASHGGASPGEKAAYAARLNSHLQRFQRYPAEAQRDGISGSARMAITIDRGGRLLSSRLTGSSGSAILDEAAKATASRASPYPPPPDGIAGRTLTFAATIRFRR